ncbi:MAG: hypothetical protein IT372_00740 [Polyangiaceae bacterium]|nr:hypothetical protein [Polyangiaceae bacterium]
MSSPYAMASRAPLRASSGALLAARAARGWIAPQVASLLAHASLLAASALLVPTATARFALTLRPGAR